jgi:hypothetical protein
MFPVLRCPSQLVDSAALDFSAHHYWPAWYLYRSTVEPCIWPLALALPVPDLLLDVPPSNLACIIEIA